MSNLTDVTGIGPAMATALAGHGIKSIQNLAAASPDKLIAVRGISAVKAEAIQAAAKDMLSTGAAAPAAGDAKKPKKDKKKDKKKKSKGKKKGKKKK